MLSRHVHEESGCTNRLHLVQAGRTLSHLRFLDLQAAHAFVACSLSNGVFAMVVKSQLAAQRLCGGGYTCGRGVAFIPVSS